MDIFLKNQNLTFHVQGKSVTTDVVKRVIPQNFRGKEELMLFYTTLNGVSFPKGAKISTESFQETEDEEYYELEIEFIYSIEHLSKMWRAVKERSDDAKIFAETHIPFARDSAGNEFFIEISSGLIKYVSWEYGLEDGIIHVAHSFRDFCLHIEPLN